MLFYAYMPMLLCDCQSFIFITESYLLTYLLTSGDSVKLPVAVLWGGGVRAIVSAMAIVFPQ